MSTQKLLLTSPTTTWKDLRFWETEKYAAIKELISKTPDLQPPPDLVFRPLIETKLQDVKVVFVNREPHVMNKHADGLAFSSSKPVRILDDLPMTTTNLFTELLDDQQIRPPKNGSLRQWAKQGVLLLNDTWTVELNRPFSHAHKGWDALTDEILETVWLVNPRCVFVFFTPCRESAHKNMPQTATIIKVQSPSPTTAYTGFFRSKIFTKVNEELKKTGQRPINWQL